MSEEWDKVTVLRGGQKNHATVTKSESAVNAAKRMGIAVSTSAKDRVVGTNTTAAKGPANYQAIAKLDRENEVKPPETVSKSVGQAISNARQEKKDAAGKSMSQKDLATKINEKPQIIADYESGRAVPNTALLAKMERVLGVKLRGDPKSIGQPLGGPKKK
ncbi:hypothetical protein QFC22_005959 [Naganishia vaughanmartiniae]|uniref:Uncharacterized protein n=3 Tax=Naganishia TaxID=1851509 RepID=A0ACC2VD54_9TREE|nr:hypothetical protein QFC21_005052 [Naganishia friedmannii]KAJ9113651.1 hypothetical protein QFC22_005959 [Naganishia vaughanmartiniae]KAJ9121952.1 hypothetical protein QFC24_004535 [Naganishia onofrii]